MLMTIWTTISCSKIRISSFSWFVEYGWPSRLIFASWYLRLSILENPKNAKVKEEMMAAVLDNMNSFILWMEGDIAVATPTEPHPQNMIPHQIPWPNSYFNDPTIQPVLQINDMYKKYDTYMNSLKTEWYKNMKFLRTFSEDHQLSEYGSEGNKKEDDINDGRKQLWKQLSLICPTWSHFNITNIISFFFGDIFVRCCFPQNFFTATWVENKKKILLKIV